MNAQLLLTSVQKCYGNKIGLELKKLALWPGRLYILTGPNGSGKSTLLNILALLSKPERGELIYAGERITWKSRELSLLRKKVTLMHQSPYLFAGTVFDNVAFGLKTRGVSGEELRRSVAESLALVGLNGFEGRNVTQLSGGEARRVALARALAAKPELLLLDEPLAHVDKESAEVIEKLIASLPARGTTVVMSTHDQHQNDRLGGERIELLGGRLEQPFGLVDNLDTSECKVNGAPLCPALKMHIA